MPDLKIGDEVEVLDPGLATLRNMMERITKKPAPPNNIGKVAEIMDDGEILVEFPIGDDDPEEHSQVAPYPAGMVRLRKETR
jgi:hypothetical protein